MSDNSLFQTFPTEIVDAFDSNFSIPNVRISNSSQVTEEDTGFIDDTDLCADLGYNWRNFILKVS